MNQLQIIEKAANEFREKLEAILKAQHEEIVEALEKLDVLDMLISPDPIRKGAQDESVKGLKV